MELPSDLQHLSYTMRSLHIIENDDFLRVQTIVSPLRAQGWSSLELEVMRQVILKYGFGCWHHLSAEIHTRSSQQIYNKLQWMLFKPDFAILSGSRLDIFVLRSLLMERRNNRNYTHITRDELLPYASHIEPESIEIPFLPMVTTKCTSADIGLQTVLKGIQAVLLRAVDGNVISRLQEQIKHHLTGLPYSSLELSDDITVHLEGKLICAGVIVVRLTEDDTTLLDTEKYFGSRSNVDERWFIRFSLDWLPAFCTRKYRDLLQVELFFVTNNLFRISKIRGRCHDFLVAPKRSSPVELHITPASWRRFIASTGKFDALHVDPPWKVGKGNPLYGFSMNYRTLEFHEIMSLDIESGLKPGGLMLIWVVNAHIHNIMQVLKQRNLKFLKAITWVKVSSRGRLQPVMGHYLQHVTETCLVLMQGEFINERSKKILNRLPTSFREKKTVNSAKPQTLMRILRDAGNTGVQDRPKFADVFGRFNNLEDGWYTVGLDAKQCIHHISKTS